MHEMGHVLGYEHSSSLDLMYASLPLGERRLPTGADAALTALALKSNSTYRASEAGVLDQVLASFGTEDKKDWSWL